MTAAKRNADFWRRNYLNEHLITQARLDIHRPLSNPRTLVNVGSHLAAEAMPFIEQGWRVFAFEPNPALAVQLREMERTRKNFTFIPKAVANTEADALTFYVSDRHSGVSSLVKRDPESRAVTVPVTTLRKFCAEYGVDAIDYLLVDAELKDLEVVMSHDPAVPIGAMTLEFGGNLLPRIHEAVKARWPHFEEMVWEYRKPLDEQGREKMGVAARCVGRSSYRQYMEKVNTDAPRGKWGNVFYYDPGLL